MKSQNSTGTLDPAIAPVPATGQGTCKTNKKKLSLTLEAEPSGSAVVLHCQGRIIFRSEACALSTIVTEVLPSAHRMVVDLAAVDSVDSGGLGELVLTQMWADAAGYKLKFARPASANGPREFQKKPFWTTRSARVRIRIRITTASSMTSATTP